MWRFSKTKVVPVVGRVAEEPPRPSETRSHVEDLREGEESLRDCFERLWSNHRDYVLLLSQLGDTQAESFVREKLDRDKRPSVQTEAVSVGFINPRPARTVRVEPPPSDHQARREFLADVAGKRIAEKSFRGIPKRDDPHPLTLHEKEEIRLNMEKLPKVYETIRVLTSKDPSFMLSLKSFLREERLTLDARMQKRTIVRQDEAVSSSTRVNQDNKSMFAWYDPELAEHSPPEAPRAAREMRVAGIPLSAKEIQEAADLAFARQLQEEFNRNR